MRAQAALTGPKVMTNTIDEPEVCTHQHRESINHIAGRGPLNERARRALTCQEAASAGRQVDKQRALR
jgi:hypothetical protein